MVPAALLTALAGAGLLVLILLALIAGAYLARQRLLAATVAIVVGLLSIALLVRLRELLVLILAAAVVAFILDAPIQRMERRIPRWAAILIVYLGAAGLLTLAGVLLVPRLVHQSQALIAAMPAYAAQAETHSNRLLAWYEESPPALHAAVDQAVETARAQSEKIVASTAEGLLGIAGWFVKSILVLVLSIYLLTDKDRLRDLVYRATPEAYHDEVRDTLRDIGQALGGYLRAQAVVILFVAVTVSFVLWLFHIPHALLIGLAAGVLEVIPYFGAFAGAVPGVLLSLANPWYHTLAIVGAFIAINQIEGHVVLPLVVGHHLEMRPLWILVSLLAGHFLFGIPGMILAVPVVAILRIVVPRLYHLYLVLHRHEQRTER